MDVTAWQAKPQVGALILEMLVQVAFQCLNKLLTVAFGLEDVFDKVGFSVFVKNIDIQMKLGLILITRAATIPQVTQIIQ